MITTTQPTRAPEVEAPEKSDVIELTISEVDRQTALDYYNNHNCVICTALRNRGLNARVGPFGAHIDDGEWVFETPVGSITDLHFQHERKAAPFYGPKVVGKVIRLRKVR